MTPSFLPYGDSTLRLTSSHALGVTSTGSLDGFPVFHFHGHGSSRLEVHLVAAAARKTGVLLIGLDRPGIGLSDPWPHFQILDWPPLVAEVADRLSLDRFAVLGVSAGGAYALACAYQIPERLFSCGVVSTVPPSVMMRESGPGLLRMLWRMEDSLPWLYQAYTRVLSRFIGSDEATIEKYLFQYRARLGAADQRILDQPELRKALVRALAESHRQGGEANRNETLNLARPWGFEIGKILFEEIYLWHGNEDRAMPPAPARQLAQALPQCTATFFPDEGHFSTLANHAEEILGAIKSARGS